MRFRQHRGGLSDSLETVVHIDNRAALLEHLAALLAPFYFDKERIDKGLKIEPYGGIDARIGWNTYIVTLERYGVLGFTDGPCPQL